jgi:hypothetical protein
MVFISQNAILSFLPRIQVRDKLRQESRVLDLPGFRIKVRNDSLEGSRWRNRDKNFD